MLVACLEWELFIGIAHHSSSAYSFFSCFYSYCYFSFFSSSSLALRAYFLLLSLNATMFLLKGLSGDFSNCIARYLLICASSACVACASAWGISIESRPRVSRSTPRRRPCTFSKGASPRQCPGSAAPARQCLPLRIPRARDWGYLRRTLYCGCCSRPFLSVFSAIRSAC